jgi:hypothetical protein
MERSAAARRLVRWVLRHLWTPVGAGVKSEEEVDALCLYLFGDSPEGREHIREIDRSIAEVPGLEGLTILEDYLEGALVRAAKHPGWAGTGATPAIAAGNGHVPAPVHWAPVTARED